MDNESKEKDFVKIYFELNSENKNYANCVLQTLMFAQNTMKTDSQKAG